MSRRRFRGLVVAAAAVCALGAAASVGLVSHSGRSAAPSLFLAKSKDPDSSAAARFRNGNEALSWDAYQFASRAYPYKQIDPRWQRSAARTFDAIASRTPDVSSAPNPALVGIWQPYGPTIPTEPGLLNFSGAPYVPASRTPALAISPICTAARCRLWAGTAGGGVWRTDNALDAQPDWKFLSAPFQLNAIGKIAVDPTDPTGSTLYVGTGEANTCSSGCELGVGIYKTTDGGNSWAKLASACASNATYACTTVGQDAFNGLAISEITVDPTNPSHIFVASGRNAVRGLSHNIGGGGQNTLTPGAEPWGLYESTDGGATFTRVWDGAGTNFAVNDIGLDPLDPRIVYASGQGTGIYRRCPTAASAACGNELGASTTDFKQVFANESAGDDFDRTMFDLTTKNSKTRIYVGDGNENGNSAPFDAFWRTDNANQSSAALLASQTAGATAPAGNGVPFPAVYNGWQKLTANTTASPYFATYEYCEGQCSYDNDVYTPKSPALPDTVYVIGSFAYDELPCYTKGVGCGSGRSNGRAVLYSTTAGDPDPANNNRTFTDMTYDGQNVPASWCALAGISSCLVAQHSIHPDQHEILINPSNPNQFFESSDGGIVRTNGTYANLSRSCSFRGTLTSGSMLTCQRVTSRVPTELGSINAGLRSLQYFGFAYNPSLPCDVLGGTQDNGTWRPVKCDSERWTQVIYGDGGTPGFDTTTPTWMFNEFVFGFSDSNFRNGDPSKWVITSAPLASAPEAVAFYWPQIPDPNPPVFNGQQTHPIFSGLQHVWRTWAFGAGRPQASVPQQTQPDVAFYEANCPEFTTSGTNPNCGDYQPLGGAAGSDTSGDLTGAAYGSDRAGGVITWMARNKSDNNTLWALTTGGRVFVSYNANATNPASVVWYRLDNLPQAGTGPAGCVANGPAPAPNCSPSRFPSDVYPDPTNPNRVWISYSGYNAATPTTPGHVFRVDLTTAAGVPTTATWTNLNVESATSTFPTPTNNGDLPVASLVRDDSSTGTPIYAATDFGVVKGASSGTGGWTVTAGMPRFEVTHLEIVGDSRTACTARCAHSLYGVTHSQGIWVMALG